MSPLAVAALFAAVTACARAQNVSETGRAPGSPPVRIRQSAEPPTAVPASSSSPLQEGWRALGEGLPQVAAYKLRAFLRTDPPPAQRREAALALVRALLATNRAEDAASALREQALLESDGQMRYWRAQIQFARENWVEALADFQAAADGEPSLAAEARYGAAETLLKLRRPVEAETLLAGLSTDSRMGTRARLRRASMALDGSDLAQAARLVDASSSNQNVSLAPQDAQIQAALLGRLRLLQRQPAQAERILTAALGRPQGMSESLLVDHYQGLAQACLAQSDPGKAEDTLESFLDHYPRVEAMPNMLAWLDQLYAVDPAPDDLADLRRWSADGSEPERQALASLALSRGEARSGRTDRAEAILERFADDFPDHPLRSQAWLDLAALRLREARTADAKQALLQARALTPEQNPDVRMKIDALDARISLAEGNHADAAEQFQEIAARAPSPAQAEAAAFDAVLAWMRAADAARATAAEKEFVAHFPRSRLKEEFPLEEGLAEAAHASAEDPTARQHAAALLRRFLQDDPLHPRAPEARIALAELAFLRRKPNLSAAKEQLAKAGFIFVQNSLTNPGAAAPQIDRAEYLAIWLADAPGKQRNEAEAVRLAKQFLERRPDSPLAAEVRMKLSEIYFRQGNYYDAQSQLELLVDKNPSSPLAEQAQYLAGLAAERLMNPAGLAKAVKLFGDTARRDGPLKLSARLRQAEVQNLLKRPQDALTLYEDVLSATADANLADAALEARCAALAGKGQTLLDMAAADTKRYPEAIQTFDLLAATAKASLMWRRQALTKKGKALEKMGDAGAALAAYLDALNAEPASDEPPEPEWKWFYLAGSYAASLLESQKDWAGAIAVYQKLATADGILKNEFESLLKSRQLEHFLWTE